MIHVAIMKPEWKLTGKIISGEKTIESRWYKVKYPPWNKIKKGDTVYFKEGAFVLAKAKVERVLQFSLLTPRNTGELLDRYAERDGIGDKKDEFFHLFKNKKYCVLIFLKNSKKIKPFKVNKKGFGDRAAWICADNLDKIKKSHLLCIPTSKAAGLQEDGIQMNIV